MLDKVTNIFSRPAGNKNSDKFSLTGFVSELNKSGIARPAYFSVMINSPPKLVQKLEKSKMDAIAKGMILRIESAELPQRGMMTHDQAYYGPRRLIPYAYNPQPITLSVILSEDYREREFFMTWQDMFLGSWRRPDAGGSEIPRQFDTGYYDDCVGTVDISAYATSPAAQTETNTGGGASLFGELSEIARAVGYDPSRVTDPFGLNLFGGGQDRAIAYSLKTHLVEAYPIDINTVPLSWGEDGYGKLTVTMQYRYFTEDHRSYGPPTEQNSLARSLRDGINAFNRFKPVFSVIRGQGAGGAARATAGQQTGAVTNVGRSVIRF